MQRFISSRLCLTRPRPMPSRSQAVETPAGQAPDKNSRDKDLAVKEHFRVRDDVWDLFRDECLRGRGAPLRRTVPQLPGPRGLHTSNRKAPQPSDLREGGLASPRL